jgi:hypothetical protein
MKQPLPPFYEKRGFYTNFAGFGHKNESGTGVAFKFNNKLLRPLLIPPRRSRGRF